MSRNLDAAMAAALPGGAIMPVILAEINFKSGTSYVWSGVGDLVYAGNTYSGVGALGKISPIVEGVDVHADGMQVALSGIGTVSFVPGAAPSGLTPPVSVSEGQFVAWSTPGAVTVSNSDPTIDSITADLQGAAMSITGASSPGVSATWSGFLPPALPPDAVIQSLYPTAILETDGADGAFTGNSFGAPGPPAGGWGPQQYSAGSIGSTLAALESASLFASLSRSLGGPAITQMLGVTNPVIAIYYTSATNAVGTVSEAMQDVQLGAPAKIWFGLLQDGTLIGSPYLIFSGLVDQPTVETGVDTSAISLALENRLSDLARPSARRYTAADQHIKYPDDTGFNFVEILNDISLRWGS